MAKPTKYATPICLVLTVIAAIGIIAGVLWETAWPIIIALVPAVGYEAYRTEGESTRWASWALVGVLALEIILLVFNVSFDVAGFLGETERTVAGYSIPLGDIRVVGPALMGVLAIILIVRTRGVYTRWLAGIIIACVLAAVYVLSPDAFAELLRQGVEEGLDEIG